MFVLNRKPSFKRSVYLYSFRKSSVIPLCWPITSLWFQNSVLGVVWWMTCWSFPTAACSAIVQLDFWEFEHIVWNNAFKQVQELGRLQTVLNVFSFFPLWRKRHSVIRSQSRIQTVVLTINVLSPYLDQFWGHSSSFFFIGWRPHELVCRCRVIAPCFKSVREISSQLEDSCTDKVPLIFLSCPLIIN